MRAPCAKCGLLWEVRHMVGGWCEPCDDAADQPTAYADAGTDLRVWPTECVSCGAPHDRLGELCWECQDETIRAYQRSIG